MSERPTPRETASRTAGPEHRETADGSPQRTGDATGFSARLTIDVTPELRGRIKIAAFRRGRTVADMLREMFSREFPSNDGDPS